MPVDNNFNPIPVLPVGKATDISNTTIEAGNARIIRISATTDCRVWQYKDTKQGEGVLIAEGTVEYFSVYEGYSVEITGSANVMG